MKKKKRLLWNNLVIFLFLLSGCSFISPDSKEHKRKDTAQVAVLSKDYLASSGDKKAELGKQLSKYNVTVLMTIIRTAKLRSLNPVKVLKAIMSNDTASKILEQFMRATMPGAP